MKRNKIIAITILVAVIIVGVILAVVFGSAKKADKYAYNNT